MSAVGSEYLVQTATLRHFRQQVASGMLAAHWREVIGDGEPDPDWAMLREIEQRGALLVLIACDADGEILGYAISQIAPCLEDRGISVCTNIAIYVDPDARRKGIAERLMGMTATWARSRQASQCLWHAAEGSQFCRYLDGLKRTKRGQALFVENL